MKLFWPAAWKRSCTALPPARSPASFSDPIPCGAFNAPHSVFLYLPDAIVTEMVAGKLEVEGKKYLLAPEPTTTGAVRLEDKKAGVVWLQIANKSMLMNAKIGQRMVDECIHPTQQI